MATLSLLTSGTTGVTPYGTGSIATAAFTTTSGSLVVPVLLIRDDLSGNIAASLTCVDGANTTYTSRIVIGKAGGEFMQGRMWTGVQTTTGSRTITFDCGVSSVGAYQWFIYEVTGHNTSTPTAASASSVTLPFSGSASFTLSAAPVATSIVIAGLGIDAGNVGTMATTPGAGWTQDGFVGSTVPQCYSQAQHRTGSVSNTVTWANVAAGTSQTFSACGMALEILAAAPVVNSHPFYYNQLVAG